MCVLQNHQMFCDYINFFLHIVFATLSYLRGCRSAAPVWAGNVSQGVAASGASIPGMQSCFSTCNSDLGPRPRY